MKRCISVLFSHILVCAVFVFFGVGLANAAPVNWPTSGCFDFTDVVDVSESAQGLQCDGGVADFGVSFAYGKIFGEAICSSTSASVGDLGSPSSNSGSYCWCNLTGYDRGGLGDIYGSSYRAVLAKDDFGNAEECSSECGCLCADLIGNDGSFRELLYHHNNFCVSSCTRISALDSDFVNEGLDGEPAFNGMNWSTSLTNGKSIKGKALCSQTTGTNGRIGSPADNNGSVCWCRATEYYDGNTTYGAYSSSWFNNDQGYQDNAECVAYCAKSCASTFVGDYISELGAGEFCRGNIVEYRCGVASGTAPVDSHSPYEPNSLVTTPATAGSCVVPNGQVFTGWSCNGVNVNPGSSFTISADTVCTAEYAAFNVTTTSLSARSKFKFKISASGTFNVDCGENGVLSAGAGCGVSGSTITRVNTTECEYTCTYSTGGVKTIKFRGTATGYNTGSYATISFLDNTAVASLAGGLSSVFPILGSGAGNYPMFFESFFGCTNLTSIPSTLFSGYSGNLSGNAKMFPDMFSGCTSLQSLPSGLFGNITGAVLDDMFYGSGLTSIPSGLFNNFRTGSFSGTFKGTRITSVPSGLFDGITTGEESMFYGTFSSCTGLTTIPDDLFANITTAAAYMFKETFYGDSNLTGYISPELFDGLTPRQSSYPASMMDSTFSGTGLATSCPSGTHQVITGYESYWDSKVACADGVGATFSVTTTSLAANDTVKFAMSAQGTFTVDCGANGVLSAGVGCGVSGSTITRVNTTECEYTCTYSTGGIKTIGFSGTATVYNTNAYPAIRFNTSTKAKIASLSGSLEPMFPVLGNSANQRPIFSNTFMECTALTTVPGTLFSGYTGGTGSMFYNTFNNCTSLREVPSSLFSGITTSASYMFGNTFRNSGLTSVPAGLFDGITTGEESMFRGTFYGTGFTSLPSGLFSNITTGAAAMFRETFAGSSLTSLPNNLFSSITTSAASMFERTFVDSTGLSSLPSGLFSGITTSAASMFKETFYYCSSLAGYIPPTMFSGLISNNHPYTTDMMTDIFAGTNLATSCSGFSGKAQYITGYESYWNSKVSCDTGYTVSYACGTGGTGTPTDANSPYVANSSVTTLPGNSCTAANQSYIFDYWDCGTLGHKAGNVTFTMPSANVACTASWEQPNFSLGFSAGDTNNDGTGTVPNGSLATTSYHIGDTVTLPSSAYTAPTGYHLSGWICNQGVGSVVAGGTFAMPALDVTCTAQWAGNEYTVNFSCGGGSLKTGQTSSVTVVYGQSFDLHSAVSRCEKGCSDIVTSGTHNIDGWVCDYGIGVGNNQNEYLSASSGTWNTAHGFTCTAQWVTHATPITYNCGTNGSVISGQSGNMTGSLTCGSSINLSNAASLCQRNGYHVSSNSPSSNGWRCHDDYDLNHTSIVLTNGQTSSDMSQSMTCVAQWDQNYLAYNCAGSQNSVMHGSATDYPTYGGSYITQSLSDRCIPYDGMDFLYWACKNADTNQSVANLNENTIINPYNYNMNLLCVSTYEGHTYTISYVAHDSNFNNIRIFGTTASTTAQYGEQAQLATNGFTATGYNFSSWSCRNSSNVEVATYGSGQVVASWPHTSDLTCYAQWVQNNTPYTVSYSCGTGSGTPPASNTNVTYNSTFTPAANTCSKTGHTFTGWLISETNDIVSPGVSVTWGYVGNKVLTAQWEPNMYTTTYDCGGGSVVSGYVMQSPTEYHSYGSAYELWSVDNYCERACYESTLSGTHNVGGWVCSNGGFDNNYLPAASGTWTYTTNYTCTAQWRAVEYTVSFLPGDSNNNDTGTAATGSMSPLTMIHGGNTVTAPNSTFTSPTACYEFDKWYCSNGVGYVNAGSTFVMPCGSVKCTAQWKLKDFTVSFAAGDSNNSSSGGTAATGTTTSLTGKHCGDTITLPSNGFSLPGYGFVNWHCDSPVNIKNVGETFTMSSSNVGCTAWWSANVISTSWSTGTGTTTNSSCIYDGIMGLPSAPSRIGYIFDGWRVNVPVGYTELQWLQSSGTQYINTGYVLQETDTVEVDYALQNLSAAGDKFIIGQKPSGNNNMWVETYGSTNKWYVRWGSSASVNANYNSSQVSGTFKISKNSFIVNGTQILQPAYSGMNPNPLTLFGRINSDDSFTGAYVRISRVRIKNGAITLHEYVPCKRDNDSAVGMCDRADGVFYPKAGSGTFTEGPAVQ